MRTQSKQLGVTKNKKNKKNGISHFFLSMEKIETTLCCNIVSVTKSTMTTIKIPTSFNTAITELCDVAKFQAVKELSEKYGFDIEEAEQFLNLTGSYTTNYDQHPDKSTLTCKAKRALTGYLTYSNSVRLEVTHELTSVLGEGEKMKRGAVMAAIGVKWKSLEQNTKDHWNDVAKGIQEVVHEVVHEEHPKDDDIADLFNTIKGLKLGK